MKFIEMGTPLQQQKIDDDDEGREVIDQPQEWWWEFPETGTHLTKQENEEKMRNKMEEDIGHPLKRERRESKQGNAQYSSMTRGYLVKCCL